jgi:hypothetical protein
MHMDDEIRDPELERLRTHWDAPPPGPGFHERVLAGYGREAPTAWWRRWLAMRVPLPLAAAAVLMAFLLAWLAPSHLRKPEPAGLARYRPVSQPRFIVVSQGENP